MPVQVVVIILFMIALFVTYQLMIFPVFEAFDRMRWSGDSGNWGEDGCHDSATRTPVIPTHSHKVTSSSLGSHRADEGHAG